MDRRSFIRRTLASLAALVLAPLAARAAPAPALLLARVGPTGIPATRFGSVGCATVATVPDGRALTAYNFFAEPVAPHAAVILKRVGTEHRFWLVTACECPN